MESHWAPQKQLVVSTSLTYGGAHLSVATCPSSYPFAKETRLHLSSLTSRSDSSRCCVVLLSDVTVLSQNACAIDDYYHRKLSSFASVIRIFTPSPDGSLTMLQNIFGDFPLAEPVVHCDQLHQRTGLEVIDPDRTERSLMYGRLRCIRFFDYRATCYVR